MSPEERWQAFGRAGLIVSICYGPLGAHEYGWSVAVLSPRHGDEFEHPYAVHTLTLALDLVDTECRRRGWLTAAP
jgi:hypothetical protein